MCLAGTGRVLTPSSRQTRSKIRAKTGNSWPNLLVFNIADLREISAFPCNFLIQPHLFLADSDGRHCLSREQAGFSCRHLGRPGAKLEQKLIILGLIYGRPRLQHCRPSRNLSLPNLRRQYWVLMSNQAVFSCRLHGRPGARQAAVPNVRRQYRDPRRRVQQTQPEGFHSNQQVPRQAAVPNDLQTHRFRLWLPSLHCASTSLMQKRHW